jgi:hypothetical protein
MQQKNSAQVCSTPAQLLCACRTWLTPLQIDNEKREKGFALYVNGANSPRRCEHASTNIERMRCCIYMHAHVQ